ncbi:MAG: hypothetical protein KAS23_10900 [Anaerohalosphaera sp.]|nr:hypothetical protein [Anaerohalosphaera sp.]
MNGCKTLHCIFTRVSRLCVLILLLLTSISAAQITHTVRIQPIIARADDGSGPAKCNIVEEMIDTLYAAAGIDYYFFEPVYYDNTKVRDGKLDVDIIVKNAKKDRIMRGDGNIINLFFVKAINNKPAPRGLGQTPGWITFIAMADTDNTAQDAFVVAHETAHNLGLKHAVEDKNVPDDVPNVMGDGPYEQRVSGKGLTEYQIRRIHKAPQVVQRFECLGVEAGKKVILDEVIEPYVSQMQKREMAAFTGKELQGRTLEECRVETKKRFAVAVLPFTKVEEQAVMALAKETSNKLMKDYPKFAKLPWRFVKVKDTHCGGFPHTRADCIVLSRKTVMNFVRIYQAKKDSFRRKYACQLLAHEQLHVFQRFHPGLMAGLYEDQWGFIQAKVQDNDWMTRNQISNPDALKTCWVVPYPNREKPEKYLWMRTVFRGNKPLPTMGADFWDIAVELEKEGKSFKVKCQPDNIPMHSPIRNYPEYKRRFPVARGLDHPHEIAAYAFGEIVFKDHLQPIMFPLSPDDDKNSKPYNRFRQWCKENLK